jgi:lysophospholipase L1-like esterase
VSAAAIALLILGSAVLAGCGGGGDKQTAAATPKSYYLALGDSLAYGFQPGKSDAKPRPSAFDTGYVDAFAARLRKLSPKTQVVNYGCPGETTLSFTRGPCPWVAEGNELHDAYRGSQLAAALSFLRAHADEVSPITLTLWGNDLFPLSEKGEDAPRAIASVTSRLNSILKRLRGAAPGAEIIVTGAWDPEADQLEETQPVYRSLDRAIGRVAAASRADVAKTFAVFNPPGTVRAQKARLCTLTFICSEGDVHPTDAGYRAMAGAFLAASGFEQKQ